MTELHAGKENLTHIMKEEGTHVAFMRLLRKNKMKEAQAMIEEVLSRRRKEIDGEEST